jgi:alcohol dehydrogenase
MLMNQLLAPFYCPSTIHLGQGVKEQVVPLLSALKARRVMVVVDAAVMTTAFFSGIKHDLDQSAIAWTEFHDVEPDPSADTVQKAFEILRHHHADVVLAIGGGSTLDVAKAIGILATNGGRIHDYEGIDVYQTPPLPLIAIPTTAGTGSEVSGSCVITDHTNNRKMSIRHARLNPARYALLDPDALATLPAHVAAHAGIDAFVHALESLTSKQANLITDALNLQAIGLIAANLPAFVKNRDNTEAALKMLVGSALAGMAFGQTGLGNVHCMARFVGAQFHVSHGLSNALCLPAVARFNRVSCVAKYAAIGRAMEAATVLNDDESASLAAIDAIENLCRTVGIPAGLRHVGACAEALQTMASDCAKAGYNRWNPRDTSESDFLALFKAAY